MVLTYEQNKRDCKRIQIAEMEVLHSVAVYTVRDGQRNGDIRKELSIFSIYEKIIIQYRIKWKHRLNRQPDGNMSKKAWQYTVRCKTDPGRPKARRT